MLPRTFPHCFAVNNIGIFISGETLAGFPRFTYQTIVTDTDAQLSAKPIPITPFHSFRANICEIAIIFGLAFIKNANRN